MIVQPLRCFCADLILKAESDREVEGGLMTFKEMHIYRIYITFGIGIEGELS